MSVAKAKSTLEINKENEFDSLLEGINKPIELILKKIRKERYSELMKQAKNDPKYQQRTMECQGDFDGIDSDITFE